MTLRRFLVAAAALAAAPAMAADPSPPPQSDTAASTPAPRATAGRRIDRARAGSTPLKPRIIDAPGAALMLIPASWGSDDGDGLIVPFAPFAE